MLGHFFRAFQKVGAAIPKEPLQSWGRAPALRLVEHFAKTVGEGMTVFDRETVTVFHGDRDEFDEFEAGKAAGMTVAGVAVTLMVGTVALQFAAEMALPATSPLRLALLPAYMGALVVIFGALSLLEDIDFRPLDEWEGWE